MGSIGDVVGYYTNSSLKELAMGAPVLEVGLTSDCPIPKGQTRACALVEITAPVDGKILVSASGYLEALKVNGGDTLCSITTGNVIGPDGTQETTHSTATVSPVSLTRGFPAIAGTTYDYSLLCETTVSVVTLRDLQMQALYVAN